VREKLRIFPYAQYSVGIGVSLAFLKTYSNSRSMVGFKSNTQNVAVTSGADRLTQQRKQQDFMRCQRRRYGDNNDVVRCALFGLFWDSLLANVA